VFQRLPRLRLLLIGLVAVAALATACGSDDTTDDRLGLDTDTEEPTDDVGEEPDSSETTEDTSPDTEAADPPTTEPLELTASDRGVTETAIKVGVIAADLESIRAIVDLDHGSYENAYAALIADVNANGGILGRDIEMVFDDYLPIGTAELDTICARMTQDEQVFAVIGGLLDDGPLCYTALNDTAMIGSTQNERRLAESSAPWFTGDRNSDDALEVTLRGFDRQGIFGGATVAVVAAAADRAQVEGVAVPLLEELQIDIVDLSYIEASPIDTVASDAEAQLIAEKQKAAGADLALAIGGGSGLYAGGIEDTTYRPRIATTSLGSVRGFIFDRSGRDLSILDGAVAGNTGEQLEWWDDPAIQDCIAIVEASGEPTIFDPYTRPEGEPENLVSVANACRHVSLFVAIATLAGANLTNETFGEAGANLGDFHVPGFGDAFYDADSPDGGVPVFFYEWDSELQDLRTDGTTL
jgi:hypothetical protein